MSAINRIIGKTFLGQIFPEIDWAELDQMGYEEIYQQLQGTGSIILATSEYIRTHRLKIGFLSQNFSGGGWTLLRDITIAPGTNLNDRYTLSLIIHEVFHLTQPILDRLSVVGELQAWQYQSRGYQQAFGKNIGDPGEAFSGTQDKWDELSQLSPASRDDLGKARELMKEISPRYRSDCLPLFSPLKELWYFLKEKDFKSGLAVIRNLITCRQ